jgi:hypothetical protein
VITPIILPLFVELLNPLGFSIISFVSSWERDRYYAEGAPAASLYGAMGAPTSEVELEMLFHAMRPAGALGHRNEFLTIMRYTARGAVASAPDFQRPPLLLAKVPCFLSNQFRGLVVPIPWGCRVRLPHRRTKTNEACSLGFGLEHVDLIVKRW